ncbi:MULTISPECIES: N-acetylglucosamine kinase [Allobacillus]|nr:BadF/BadG/BcrA/BcrD ATPase family protein [Allobacillus salarius]
MSYVIGIDGGGTKTEAVLSDETGQVYARVLAGPSNLNSGSRESIEGTFLKIFSEIKNQQPELFQHIDYCFAGLSGTENHVNKEFIEALFKRLVGGQFPYLIEHDAVNALYSGTFGEPGIVQIAGTGSIGFGIDQHLNKKRVGGWGYLIGDEGSGYAIGRDALQVIFQHYDRNQKETILANLIGKYFEISGDLKDIVPTIYQAESPRNHISALSKVVFEAFDMGDTDAKSILQRAAKDLSKSIEMILEHFPLSNKQVVLVGGLFNRNDVILPMLEHFLNEECELILPKVEPVIGSVIAALQQINQKYIPLQK